MRMVLSHFPQHWVYFESFVTTSNCRSLKYSKNSPFFDHYGLYGFQPNFMKWMEKTNEAIMPCRWTDPLSNWQPSTDRPQFIGPLSNWQISTDRPQFIGPVKRPLSNWQPSTDSPQLTDLNWQTSTDRPQFIGPQFIGPVKRARIKQRKHLPEKNQEDGIQNDCDWDYIGARGIVLNRF